MTLADGKATVDLSPDAVYLRGKVSAVSEVDTGAQVIASRDTCRQIALLRPAGGSKPQFHQETIANTLAAIQRMAQDYAALCGRCE